MEPIIPFPSYNSDEKAIELVDYLKHNEERLDLETSTLYYKFPALKEFDDENLHPDILIISPMHGIIIIQKDESTSRQLSESFFDELYEKTDSIYSMLLSKLIKIANLRKKRTRNKLKVPINTIIYLPNLTDTIREEDEGSNFWANNLSKIDQVISSLPKFEMSEEELTDVFSIIDGTRNMPRSSKRELEETDEDTKGAILNQLELQIAKFDKQQKIAALTIVDGPQRIRGMAGSGKTVVLAMKAALIHIEQPEANILYTFYTKSLYDQIKQLITRFYRMSEDHDPNWDKIHIQHAWGGKTLPGVYYNACVSNNISPIGLREANINGHLSKMKPFEYVCYDLLAKTNGRLKQVYDYLLLDEGQDFPNTFYWLCRKLVKNDRLIWAYDELQNILNIDIQETQQLFENEFGDKGIDLEELHLEHPYQNNDIVLHKSYRNPREILLISHSLGFGMYNDRMVQRLENKEHWIDLGYEVQEGNCKEGEDTLIHRPKQNSPSIISDFYDKDMIIVTKTMDSIEEEAQWVANEIIDNITKDRLLPEDIMVISLDDKFARSYFSMIGKLLADQNIYVNNLLESYSGDTFILNEKVTLTTVYRAKGNEAAMVYIIGGDSLKNGRYDIISRNKLFTAFTRAKGWIRFSGVGDNFNYLLEEISKAKQKLPNLEFTYPGYEEIKTLRRELSQKNAEKNRDLSALMEKINELGFDREHAINLLQGENDK
ncbi:hypothetical protein CON74_25615 [Bacillus thuringiensis]|uniref:DEAD/DEAH box helicase n=1 Tax=Bacillus thuringiensis TaxID=1428 RepID=UPI000BEBDCE4|nr:ATP-binding domain-containing protein [Bacillus thuringiensis]PEA58036.1 hypothetical protein CON74_25615 [Bacillus thuringiensis]